MLTCRLGPRPKHHYSKCCSRAFHDPLLNAHSDSYRPSTPEYVARLRRRVNLFICCECAFDKLLQSFVVLFAANNKSVIVRGADDPVKSFRLRGNLENSFSVCERNSGVTVAVQNQYRGFNQANFFQGVIPSPEQPTNRQ